MTPRSPPRILARHCDRYVVTAASRPYAAGMSDFRSRCILRRTNEPVRPADRDSDIGTWVAGARLLSPDLAFPTADAVALRKRTQPTIASRRSNVTYADRTLTCVDCGVEFIHSAADQEYYVQKGFASDPKRCTSCRASRRAARDGGYDVREIGGPRGYERSVERPDREYFAVVCSSCGNQAQVPFRPRMDRPVYCSDCFRTVRPD
jgi:CxxC-x17-CxxC domain-containing protein